MGKKINDTANFPPVTPADSDRVVLIDVSDTSTDLNGAVKTALVSELVDGSGYATAAQGTKADTAVQPAAISDFESTTALNARDTANRSRANHTGTQAQSTITSLTTDLAAKAPLASPAFTGNPTAPTQTASDNSTKIATTAYVDAAAGGGGGGLVPISKTTASSVPTVDIELTGSYTSYLVRFEKVVPATDNVRMSMRTSTDGGSTFDSGASDYAWAASGHNSNAFDGDDNTQDQIYFGNSNTVFSSDSGASGQGRVEVQQSDGTLWTTVGFRIAAVNTIPGATIVHGAGCRRGATTITHVQFFMSSGNITSGVFHLYGIADGA